MNNYEYQIRAALLQTASLIDTHIRAYLLKP